MLELWMDLKKGKSLTQACFFTAVKVYLCFKFETKQGVVFKCKRPNMKGDAYG